MDPQHALGIVKANGADAWFPSNSIANASVPAFATTDCRIAVAGDDPDAPGTQCLYVVDTSTSTQPKKLACGFKDIWRPEWNPSSTLIGFIAINVASGAATDYGLWFVKSDGSEAPYRVGYRAELGPAWISDTEAAATLRRDTSTNYAVWRFSVAPVGNWQLVDDRSDARSCPGIGLGDVAVSPDHRTLAHGRHYCTGGGLWPTDYHAFVVFTDLTGTKPRWEVAFPVATAYSHGFVKGALQWSPDGGRVAALVDPNGPATLDIVDAATMGRVRQSPRGWNFARIEWQPGPSVLGTIGGNVTALDPVSGAATPIVPGAQANWSHALEACVPGPTASPTATTTSTATVTPTSSGPVTPPTVAPSVTPVTGLCVCPLVTKRVPPIAIDHALANPSLYAGWLQARDPGKPPDPIANPIRDCLDLSNPNVGYNPLRNGLLWRASCH